MNIKNKIHLFEKTSVIQKISQIFLGVFLLFAGMNHLTLARVEFLAQVPLWIPLDPDLVVVISGIAEIVLGLGLIFLPKYRVLFGIITAVFFVAIFPGNISQYVNRIDAFGLNSDQARFTRLFFQPLLVMWSLWGTGTWGEIRKGKITFRHLLQPRVSNNEKIANPE